jgi:hypothetical protein
MVKIVLHLNASVPLRPNSSSDSPGVVLVVRPGVRFPNHPQSELVGRRCRHGLLRRACSIWCPSASRCRSPGRRGRSSHSFKIHRKCIQTLKIRVRITYAELLDPSPGGPVGVGEGHVRRWHAIVPRNVREPSKEVTLPRRGDVDRPGVVTTVSPFPFPRIVTTRRYSWLDLWSRRIEGF